MCNFDVQSRQDDDDDSSSLGRPNLKDLRTRDLHDKGVDVKNLASNLHSILEREVLRICSNQEDFEETSKTERWIPNPEIEVGERRRKAWQFATKLRRQQTAKKGTLCKKKRKFWRKDRYDDEGGTFSRDEEQTKTFHFFLSLFSKIESE